MRGVKHHWSHYVAHYFHPRRSNNHRAKLLHHDSLLILTALLTIGVLAIHNLSLLNQNLARILGFASNITPGQVVELTNQERLKKGLTPLRYNKTLSEAALAKGQDMFNDQYWSHTAPDGTEPWSFMHSAGYDYIVAGENLARDFSESDQMMVAWMDSPTHKANIVNPKYQEIGVAVIDGSLLGYETTLVVQMFGSPRDQSQVASITSDGMTVERMAYDLQGIEQQPLSEGAQPAGVLAGALVPIGQLRSGPLFSPLQLSKAVVLFIVMMLSLTLVYDMFVIGHYQTMRVVGKNLAHILLLIAVAFLVVFFRGGIIG